MKLIIYIGWFLLFAFSLTFALAGRFFLPSISILIVSVIMLIARQIFTAKKDKQVVSLKDKHTAIGLVALTFGRTLFLAIASLFILVVLSVSACYVWSLFDADSMCISYLVYFPVVLGVYFSAVLLIFFITSIFHYKKRGNLAYVLNLVIAVLVLLCILYFFFIKKLVLFPMRLGW